MSNINIKIEGIEKIQAALNKFPQEIQRTIELAGEEAAQKILKEEGLQKYPPLTGANMPPYPYYKRGTGTQTSQWHNTGSSENLGKQWHVESEGLKTTVGNRASYARYVVGDEQPAHMARKGWKQLYPTAQSKLTAITGIYQRWIDRLIKKLGL